MMRLHIRVISQNPPGGRCSLYAAYAKAIAAHLDAASERVFSAERDAHGIGFPSLQLNGHAIQPADGVILMPADVCAALAAAGHDAMVLTRLAEALEAPLERMLGA
jgi:cystathionine gamma-synthase